MFAKYWRAGEVKTRLGATIGMAAAAAVHQLFVQTSLARFRHLGDRRELQFSPSTESQAFAAVAGDAWQVTPQAPGDLGDRITYYFATQLGGGATQTLLIGSDSPNLPIDYVRAAFRHLDDHDVVLGPAVDGGYYLIGLRQRCDALFTDIAWSTSDVLEQTLAKCDSLNLRTAQTPTWYDVDDKSDLKRLLAEPPECDADPDLRALHTQLNLILADCPPL
ncbi:hypothetical protein Enr8_36140 [Blastopirellula retiformator]|uniref:2-phospho-L-lactate guanylyltransferase n=2 Tax=Blastopirellula retiformator TaxID=2527970 RepID=A0A5C5V187_9BACT|nr:hypothetical protein Enr8_36140 [Blastopirellula retiformator]